MCRDTCSTGKQVGQLQDVIEKKNLQEYSLQETPEIHEYRNHTERYMYMYKRQKTIVMYIQCPG